MEFNLIYICLAAVFTQVDTQICTYLDAQIYTQHFDSHDSYSISDYDSYERSCWLITAPYDKVVHLESDAFNLEYTDICASDSLKVYDGPLSSAKRDLNLCGIVGIQNYKTTGQYAYVYFETDGSVERSGFRINYTSADADPIDETSESTAILYEYEDFHSLGVGSIIGIVVGSILGLCVLVAGIVFLIMMVVALKRRNARFQSQATGQRMVHTNPTFYPQQHLPPPGNGAPVGTPIPSMMQTSQHTPQSTASVQQPSNPGGISGNNVPMPTAYTGPGYP